MVHVLKMLNFKNRWKQCWANLCEANNKGKFGCVRTNWMQIHKDEDKMKI